MAAIYLATVDPATRIDHSEASANVMTSIAEGITVNFYLPTAWLAPEREEADDEGTYYALLDELLTDYMATWEMEEGKDAQLEALALLLETTAVRVRHIIAEKQ